LQVVARLVAPLVLARQIASVAPWPRWRPVPALRRVCVDVTLPVAPHALARQACRAMRDGATRPMSWVRAGLFSPTLSSFSSLSSPTRAEGKATSPAAAPQDPPKFGFFDVKSGVNRSPSLSEGITPNISSFNRVH